MARKSTQPATPSDANGAEINDALVVMHQIQAERDGARIQQINAVEAQYGLDIPYQLDLYVATIRQHAAESAARLVQMGRMLIQIREREPREVWLEALERCGLSLRFAQRAIQAAVKLQDREALQRLGVSKALELLSEDDDTLEQLEEGGSLAGLTLDDIDRMSVRELKATLRKERAERADEKATDVEIIKEKDERINALKREATRVARSEARDRVQGLLAELDAASIEVATEIKRLRDTASAIRAVYDETGEHLDEEVIDRIEQCAQYAARWAGDLAEELGE